MALYWLPSQLPEVKHLPTEVREEIVDHALETVPISWRNVLIFVGVLAFLSTVGIPLAFMFGPWVKYVCLLLAAPIIWMTWLNLAGSRIRALIHGNASLCKEAGDHDN